MNVLCVFLANVLISWVECNSIILQSYLDLVPTAVKSYGLNLYLQSLKSYL